MHEIFDPGSFATILGNGSYEKLLKAGVKLDTTDSTRFVAAGGENLIQSE